MGMKVALTDRINRICCQLDINPFLTKEKRTELITELNELVERRKNLDTVFDKRETEEVVKEESSLDAFFSDSHRKHS